MKLKSNQTYNDKVVKQDIPEGKIVNEIYEKLKVELTEEREKVLIAAGVVDIVEEEPVVIDPAAIIDPGEMKLDDTVSVEAKVISTESATATQENPEGAEVNPEGAEVNPEGAEVNPEGAVVNPEGAEVNPEAGENKKKDKKTSGNKAKQEKNSTIENE